MNRKLKKTVARLFSRAVVTRGAAMVAGFVVGALVRRKLRYRHDAHLTDSGVATHLNQPGVSERNPA